MTEHCNEEINKLSDKAILDYVDELKKEKARLRDEVDRLISENEKLRRKLGNLYL